ncbi:unnamed protein product [Penicillium salamii]|uniref:Uncharacterized protein n=1 Tax=Penicillium salamii TaxID=1612424 RepID=A0A9W4IKN1_9EURO|nr:unnamed protein product [Penicillium salamii]
MAFSPSKSRETTLNIDPHCDNDGFLISTLRAGGPELTSLPAFHKPVSREYRRTTHTEQLSEQRELEEEVRKILGELGINQRINVDIVGRYSMVRPEPAPIPTVPVVFADPLPIDKLIHETLLRRPHCHPISKSDPICPIWGRICGQILTDCNIQQWSGVSYWRYGTDDVPDNNPMTVIMSLLESAQGSFAKDLQWIRGILEANELEDIDILFMRDETVRL